jgi:SWI/SNF-related matrix-associated actin-dependent regulator 1 of chromatin subfamily A
VLCPKCNKERSTISHVVIGTSVTHFLKCGHTTKESLVLPAANAHIDLVVESESECQAPSVHTSEGELHTLTEQINNQCLVELLEKSIESAQRSKVTPTDNWTLGQYSPFEYQKSGVEFIEASGFNTLVADDMGLGKTAQSLIALRRNPHLFPVLISPPSSLVYNWAKEYYQWMFGQQHPDVTDPNVLSRIAYIHIDGQVGVCPGFQVYIVGHDLLRKPKVKASLKSIGFKLFIGDECHKFKNTNSQRTESVLDIVKDIPHKILLSGTPIKSRLTEYFTALHMIDPVEWKSYGDLMRYAEFGPKNQVLGLRPWRAEEFHEKTSRYIIRRKRSDVYKDLPPIRRDKRYIAVNTNKEFVGIYNRILDEIERILNTNEANKQGYLLAELQRLRHCTGLMKVAAATDFIEEFTLMEEQSQKLTIGVHHKDVGKYFTELTKTVYGIEAITMSGADDARQKQDKENEFRTRSDKRFLVASILACGEGRNLQFCENVLVVEREWTPADENQFELRFSRPLKCPACDVLYDKLGDGKYLCPKCGREHEQTHVNITYLIAKDTIDEFFDELVSLKQAISDQVLDPSWNLENDSNLIMELCQRATMSRMKYVG